MKIFAAPILSLPLLALVACVSLTKPPEVQEKCTGSDTSGCADNLQRFDSGLQPDTPATPPDAPDDPPDTTPPVDTRSPDTRITDTQATLPDTPGDTNPPKLDTRPEVATPDTQPPVVEPALDGSVPPDTKPPVDTTPDTKPPVDTTPDTKPPVDTEPVKTDTQVGSENCPSVKVLSGGQSYSPGVTGGYCLVTCDTLEGWNCSNFDGRTLKVNGKAMKCGELPLPPKVNGYYVFEVTAGTFSYSAMYWWGTPNATCPLPAGGLLP